MWSFRSKTVLLMIALLASGTTSHAQFTMDFENVPPGTQFGAGAGNTPGELVLIQDEIAMSVEWFIVGPSMNFQTAQVGMNPGLPTQSLFLDNISAEYDLAGIGCNALLVTVQFHSIGGSKNFSVNGDAIYEVLEFSDLPSQVAPGVTAAVQGSALTLEGEVDRILIGGQELAIDNIFADCQPAAADIPTVSNWGLIIMILLVAIAATVALFRVRRPAI